MLRVLLLAASLCACGQSDEVSIEVYAAALVAPDAPPAAAGERVTFPGTARGGAGVYDVGPEPLITDWSIVAFRAASQPDGSWAVVARLNAYGQKRMKDYLAGGDDRRRYLAVKVDGRWADIGPLLGPARDRLTLYGFTLEETERLDRALASR